MESLWTLIIIPVSIGVIILVTEYWIIQPILRRTKKDSQPPYRDKIAGLEGGEDPLDCLFHEATRARLTGQVGRALQLYEQIHREDPTYPDIAIHVMRTRQELERGYVDNGGRVIPERALVWSKMADVIAMMLLLAVFGALLTALRHFLPVLVTSPTSTPTNTPTLTPMDTAIPTSTFIIPVPTDTPTRTPTLMPVVIVATPTATPTSLPTDIPPSPTYILTTIPTKTPTVTPTSTPTPWPTLLPPPILLNPEGDSFIGPVLLKWEWDSSLAEAEFFALRAHKEGEMEPCHHSQVQEPEYWGDLPNCSAGKLYWYVSVVRQLCEDCPTEEQMWVELSEQSWERSIYYWP